MRLPNAAHESRPWRIREIVRDFTVEDVWALPVHGGAEDFQTLLEQVTSVRSGQRESPFRLASCGVSAIASAIWFGLDRISVAAATAAGGLPIPGTSETSLTDRLPDDLRDTATDVHFESLPFVPLYRTDVEFAAEVSNRTVHGVMHLAWVDQGDGRYQGQMAVYVKPRGRFGKAYMALIKPFRHWVRLPGADATDRTNVECTRSAIGAFYIALSGVTALAISSTTRTTCSSCQMPCSSARPRWWMITSAGPRPASTRQCQRREALVCVAKPARLLRHPARGATRATSVPSRRQHQAAT